MALAGQVRSGLTGQVRRNTPDLDGRRGFLRGAQGTTPETFMYRGEANLLQRIGARSLLNCGQNFVAVRRLCRL